LSSANLYWRYYLLTDKLDLILAKLEAMEARQNELLLEQRVLYRQIEALFALYHGIQFRAPLLSLRGWAASPDFLAIQIAAIRQHKPKTILELGSGQSTIISAYLLEELGAGHVYAFDDTEQFANLSHEALARHKLSDYATVIHAPLKACKIMGENWHWYDLDCLPAIPKIDFLLVDGPPQYGKESPMLRYPALPLLLDYLAPDALILIDDADRASEQRMVERWQAEFSLELIRHYERAYADTEKGTKLFKLKN
jgi:predicted O-methyltransferase YrrM